MSTQPAITDALGNTILPNETVAFGKRVGNEGRLGLGHVLSVTKQWVEIETASGRKTGRAPREVAVIATENLLKGRS